MQKEIKLIAQEGATRIATEDKKYRVKVAQVEDKFIQKLNQWINDLASISMD